MDQQVSLQVYVLLHRKVLTIFMTPCRGHGAVCGVFLPCYSL